MIGLILAIIVFNSIAFKTNKILTSNQIVHIWLFTIAFQLGFDVFVEFKFHGYWYFGKDVDWEGMLPHIFIVPPVNMMFLNWFPFHTKKIKQVLFIGMFEILILLYELITLLPEPWGYFHYGWWRLWHAAMIDPILLLILLMFYLWIRKLEHKSVSNYR